MRSVAQGFAILAALFLSGFAYAAARHYHSAIGEAAVSALMVALLIVMTVAFVRRRRNL